MICSTQQYTIETSHGFLAIEESGQGNLPVLLIHGNSTSHDVFQHQLQSSLTDTHRLIAFDLPGHGRSSNASDPARTYTLPGFADAAVELLGELAAAKIRPFVKFLGQIEGIDPSPSGLSL
jgi:pimeloyl-ACP methyl ester carboxylesterase